MSQYTNFFLKGDDKFYSLGDWGRSSTVAQIANKFCPQRYDVAKHFTRTMLIDLGTTAKENVLKIDDSINFYQKKIQEISTFNNPVDEKLNAIKDYEDIIADLKEEWDSQTFAYYYFNFLTEIENPIYVGIECGEQPEEVID